MEAMNATDNQPKGKKMTTLYIYETESNELVARINL